MSRHAGPAPSGVRRGLGRGLGSLIPTAPVESEESTAEAAAARASVGTATLEPPVPHQVGVSERPDVDATEGHAHPGADDARVEAEANDRAPAPVAGAHFAELPVGSIRPNPRQPRQVFEEEALAELVHSIREIGLLQPIVVRKVENEAGGSAYELVMGERRWRAAQEAGLELIPAIVRSTGDDAMLRDALLENLHRAQLNPLEEAAAYQQLLDDFGCTHEELAGRIGRSRPQISNMLRLLNLSPAVQRRVAAGVLSAGHARALLGLSDPGAQDRLAGRVVAEGISVRALEEIVAVGEQDSQGDEDGPTVRPPRPTAPGLTEVADRLSDRLDTRVRVTLGRSRGKITIDFASLGDLERIVAIVDPRNRNDRPI